MSVIAMSINDNTLEKINTSTITNNLSLNLYDTTLLKNKMENRINVPVITKEIQQQLQNQYKMQPSQAAPIPNQSISIPQTLSLTQPVQPQIIKVIQVAQPSIPNAPTQNVFINPMAQPANINSSHTLNIPVVDTLKRRSSIPNILEQQGPSQSQPRRRLSMQLNEIPLSNPDAMAIDPKPAPVTQTTSTAQPAVVAAPPQVRYIYGIPRAPSLPINNIVPTTMSPIQPMKAFPALPLSNFVVYLVNRIWYHGKPECRNAAHPEYAELTKFVEDVLKITDLSLNTVLLSLRYIYMLRQKCNTDQKILEWSLRDLIAVHFMLANKFLSDDRYSNSVWASVTGKDLDEMNRLEKKSLEILQFNLNVHHDDFKNWEKSISTLGKELRQRMTTLQQERNLKKQQAELTALLNETMSNTNVIKMPLFHQTPPTLSTTLMVNNVPTIPINPTAAINIINGHPTAAATITPNSTTIITSNTQVAPTLATSSLNLKFSPQPTNIANVAVVNTVNPAQVATVTNVSNVTLAQNPISLNAVTVKQAIPTSPKVSVTPMFISSLPTTSLPATGITIVNPTNTVNTMNANSIYPSPPLCRISNAQPTNTVLATSNFVGPTAVALVPNHEVSTVNATPGVNTLTNETSSSTLFTTQNVRTAAFIPTNVSASTPAQNTTINVATNQCRFLKHSLSSNSLKSLQQQAQQVTYSSPLSQHHVNGARLKTSNSALNLSSFKSNVFKYQPQSIINHTATVNNLNELNLPINRIPTPLNFSSPKKMRYSTCVTSSIPSVYIKKEANMGGVVASSINTSPLNGLSQVPVTTTTTTIFKPVNTSEPTIKLVPTNKPMFY
ncbi:hypothetical protein BCR36DRAFT_584440 [Piromyces finnis]|uniref:Cyclin N-terminal domain-containing protein n=1 Tax=Piromyces finnis TaxID=1754191 RepID=A0A1Y1V612_9FUNG|nr:hypothetical protein BCR36DRAFT_584440 [Piromyces finnis]|eukprot:ORX48129.1 hypothetical protein BCR36DRAFT_584440 [Piromyces finnis]